MAITFNQEQEQAIFSRAPLVVLSAGAGSGKTRVLTERFVHICEQKWQETQNDLEASFGAEVDELVAITFTEKAAREMKERIRQRLLEKVEEAKAHGDAGQMIFWQKQKEGLERARISTFHSFCQRLLLEYAQEAGIPPTFIVLDEVEAAIMKREILDDLFQDALLRPLFAKLLECYTKRSLESSLLQVYEHIRDIHADDDVFKRLDGDAMLNVQTHALLLEKEQQIAVFHEKASRLVDRIDGNDPSLTKALKDHIHNLLSCFHQLNPEAPDLYVQTLTAAMPARGHKSWGEKAPAFQQLYDEWKGLKKQWTSFSVEVQPITKEVLTAFIDLLQYFAARYKERKQLLSAFDFSDLQRNAVCLLDQEDVQKSCHDQFKHMMVDEFQDTNQMQMDVLTKINPSYQFLVGDGKQSIYRFRGADVTLMNEMSEQARDEKEAQFIEMNTNYRTTAPVIHVVNGLFAHAMKDVSVHSVPYASLIPAREPEKEDDIRVSLHITKTTEKEKDNDQVPYHHIADRLLEMVRTGEPTVWNGESWRSPNWGDMAILIPVRTELLALERALSDKGIPYHVYGGVGFYERQEILDFVTLLRWLDRPFEELYLFALLRSPMFGLTLDDLMFVKERFSDELTWFDIVVDKEMASLFAERPVVTDAFVRLRTWLDRWVPFRPVPSLIDHLYELFDQTGLKMSLFVQENGMQKVRNVEKLIDVMSGWKTNVLEELLQRFDLIQAEVEKEGEAEVEQVAGNVVHIMTVHASKGLEFPIVCLPQLDRVPQRDKGQVRYDREMGIVLRHEWEEDDGVVKLETPAFALVKEQADLATMAENKRLFYVAATRARDYLWMTGKEQPSTSSWLYEVEEALEEMPELRSHLKIEEDVASHDRWEKDIQTYKVPPIVPRQPELVPLSVTEMMTFIQDPVAYYERYILGIETSVQHEAKTKQEDSNIDPSKVGSLAHKVFELVDQGVTLAGSIEMTLAAHDWTQDERKHYEEHIQRLFRGVNQHSLQWLGEPVANEWAFSFSFEGAEIVGEIDKIVKNENEYHIIDFKTNQIRRSGAELLRFYEPQLALYAEAYEQLCHVPVKSASLFVVRDQQQPLHSLTDRSGVIARVRKHVQQLVDLRKRKANRFDYEQLGVKK
ncbi:hypothetical protein E2L07_11840 [Halalkalibacterium halodurans]|uniref:UvrD-helicase domain-containing protein n=1 Tax=Halalkalibacterium halodurans TaxID=86665 RepID=UPI001067ECCA|nr:exodeoxyribonuclease V subunit beta [Halalkalibacterium halodurans]TES53800.1 hypothetical protein E2L07_11840 [Halalkalibacterium halodurans]